MGYATGRVSKTASAGRAVLVTAALALISAPAGAAAPAIPAGDGRSPGRAAPVARPAPAGAPAARAAARVAPRRGGNVRAAWPRRQGAVPPSGRLARWIARHVGPAGRVVATPRRRAA